MRFYNIVCLVAIVSSAFGCIQQDSSCAPTAESSTGSASGKPTHDEEPNTPDNEPCSEHADCESNECVPTILHAEGSSGVCWSDSFEGCALVEFEPWVIEAMCGMRELVVCQSESTPEMQMQCVPPDGGSAPWVANLLCCDPSFL